MLLFVALLSLVLLAVLIAGVVGALLPKTRTATAGIEIAGVTARSLAAIEDVQRYPSWMPGVASLRSEEAGWAEAGPAGQWSVGRTVDPTSERSGGGVGATDLTRVTDVLRAESGASMRRVWTLRPHGNYTRVELSTERELSNPFARFGARYVQARSAAEIAVLQALARHLGERATAVVVPRDQASSATSSS